MWYDSVNEFEYNKGISVEIRMLKEQEYAVWVYRLPRH